MRFADDIGGLAGDEQEISGTVGHNLCGLGHGDQFRENKADDQQLTLIASTQTSESVAKSLKRSAALNTLDQMSHMNDHDQKFSPELHKEKLR